MVSWSGHVGKDYSSNSSAADMFRDGHAAVTSLHHQAGRANRWRLIERSLTTE
jgi:hypothetical protein